VFLKIIIKNCHRCCWYSSFLFRAGTRRNIHLLTPIMVINHPLSASSI